MSSMVVEQQKLWSSGALSDSLRHSIEGYVTYVLEVPRAKYIVPVVKYVKHNENGLEA